ncbi:twin-arginine translocase TatA/TatE family subunit [Mesorhizobium sp. CA5]|uniref:twin-arginine translocase TatA/TatE family subunit n=1 Tax=Mesorhizobium sp. CA5 TaxID=2876638 RepID=UPI001CD18FA2|nr:twin-arginine translocase TatA/TatE family subunit [Mesorhizobium sp. CA5]MBZ9843356.1 twin-arginine translocase TatA/TatE family subunit [Mesorhizobium sp. CA5]
MGTLSIWHWLIVVLVAMIFFGRGRISALMGDVGKGIRSLRQELRGIGDIEAGTSASEHAAAQLSRHD